MNSTKLTLKVFQETLSGFVTSLGLDTSFRYLVVEELAPRDLARGQGAGCSEMGSPGGCSRQAAPDSALTLGVCSELRGADYHHVGDRGCPPPGGCHLLLLLLQEEEEEPEAGQKRGEGHEGARREESAAGREVGRNAPRGSLPGRSVGGGGRGCAAERGAACGHLARATARLSQAYRPVFASSSQ